MIKIALCDDDSKALPVIAGAVRSAFLAREVKAELFRFSSGKNLLKRMGEDFFHVVLLDIDMPEIDGIETGKRIRELHPDVKIIFVSECEERVFESFAVQPLGFVRKSNFLNDIADVVDLYIRTTSQEEDTGHVEFSTRTSLISLRINQIRYFEGSRNYQLLYTSDKQDPIEIKMTMEKLEAAMGPQGFIRIHKGYLVNYRFIQRIDAAEVKLQDGTALPVGRSRAADVKSIYLSMLGSV